MIDDRLELEKLRVTFNIWAPDAETADKYHDALLRWKRGDKVWCEHILWLGKFQGWRYDWQAFMLTFLTWKFCPECGAKRPEEQHVEGAD